MKTTLKLCLLLGLLGSCDSSAQLVQPLSAPPSGSYQFSEYRNATDETLLNFNISPVTSKILYDRVFPAARLFEWSPSKYRKA